MDFDEVFAPVARLETVRLLLALVANGGLKIHHMDIKSAFLNGDLQEEVYVHQPPGSCDQNSAGNKALRPKKKIHVWT